jgi:hypothetical protein
LWEAPEGSFPATTRLFSAEIGGELPQLDFPQHPPREGSPRPRPVIVSLGEKPRAMMQANRLPIPEYQQKH